MQELRLVAVTEDGRFAVLAGPGGVRFRLRVDEQLRAAVRLDRARLGQLQIELESHVRPREIQARIRAGETAEEVAAEAGVPVEHIRRFEGPVLAERAWMAEQARAVVPRRGEGRHRTLADLVTDTLRERGVSVEDLGWDSWRRDDGTWTVRLTYPAGKSVRLATWRFDPDRRTVLPEDEDAATLTTDEQAVVRPIRRLAPVRSGEQPPAGERVYDLEADGGLEPPLHWERDSDRPVFQDRAELLPPGTEELPGVTQLPLPGSDRSRRAGTRAATPELAEAAEDESEDSPEHGPGHEHGADPSATEPAARAEEPAEEPAAEETDKDTVAQSPAAQAGEPARRRAGRRAAVPSWDDILLGTRRPE